jgi:membrane fusion protein, multidrug efflux system
MNPVDAQAQAQAKTYRPWIRWGAFAMLILLAGAATFAYVNTFSGVSTDDATVNADTVTVMAKVPAYVQALSVDDNETVKQGQLLLQLDPRDYQLAVDAAQAALDAAQSKLDLAHAQVVVAASDVAQAHDAEVAAEAQSTLATDVMNRRLRLNDLSISAEARETAQANASAAAATLSAARMKVAGAWANKALAQAQVGSAEVAVKQAKVALDQAKLNLSYTKITAAVDGTVANRTVVAGNYVEPGQLLLSLVPTQVYVIANFKETQFGGITVGQKARITVDALGRSLPAHVDSIQRGSGSVFALLPPENATGNFVKVVQRLPVKLLLDAPPDALKRLAPGMSVEVTMERSGAWIDQRL